jgi:hypothetical protein
MFVLPRSDGFHSSSPAQQSTWHTYKWTVLFLVFRSSLSSLMDNYIIKPFLLKSYLIHHCIIEDCVCNFCVWFNVIFARTGLVPSLPFNTCGRFVSRRFITLHVLTPGCTTLPKCSVKATIERYKKATSDTSNAGTVAEINAQVTSYVTQQVSRKYF